MSKYNKSIVAVIGAVAGFLITNCGDSQFTTLFVGLATALGVYEVPNKF